MPTQYSFCISHNTLHGDKYAYNYHNRTPSLTKMIIQGLTHIGVHPSQLPTVVRGIFVPPEGWTMWINYRENELYINYTNERARSEEYDKSRKDAEQNAEQVSKEQVGAIKQQNVFGSLAEEPASEQVGLLSNID